MTIESIVDSKGMIGQARTVTRRRLDLEPAISRLIGRLAQLAVARQQLAGQVDPQELARQLRAAVSSLFARGAK